MSYNYYSKQHKRNVSDTSITVLCAMFEKLSLSDTTSRKRKTPELSNPEKRTSKTKGKPTYKISLHEGLKMKIIKQVIIVTEEYDIVYTDTQKSKKRKLEEDDIYSNIYERREDFKHYKKNDNLMIIA